MIRQDVKLGKGVTVHHPELVNLYGCQIGEGTKVGAFVEIRAQVKVGRNCKIQAFAFVPEGVTLEDEVFVGPHVCFTNDRYPRATTPEGALQEAGAEWEVVPTLVKRGASVGANATVLCGVTIGEFSMVAAGAVVTKDVPSHTLVAGNPARRVRRLRGNP